MLLIAQPKSASTSLMWSLSEILKVPHKNGQNRKSGDTDCEGYAQLQKYHGTMVRRSKEYLKKWIEADIIYKEHILPTDEHLEYIKNIGAPVVVLLREPVECIKSYRRVLSVLPDKNIDYDEMRNELELFREKYLSLTDDDNYLIITYDEIVNDFTNAIKKIIVHYKKTVPDNVEKYILAKRNYTWSK